MPDSDVSFELAYIPKGMYRLGEAGTPYPLGGFWIGRKEVTWKEFHAYSKRKRGEYEDRDGITRPSEGVLFLAQLQGWRNEMMRDDHPAISLRWHTSVAYCNWLTRRTGLKFRPPTEAEWEAAARGPRTEDPILPLEERAWVKENSRKTTHPPGEKLPNGFGLYDMLGNAEENCLERFSPDSLGVALRGGSWGQASAEASFTARRTTQQEWLDPDPNRPRSLWWQIGGYTQGLRVVMVEGALTGKALDRAAKDFPLTVRLLGEKVVHEVKARRMMAVVEGTVVNQSDRSVSELEVTIYYLTPDGKPHLADVGGGMGTAFRPTFAQAYPALMHGYHPTSSRRPLRPEEKRTFRALVPLSFDEDGYHVDLKRMGARVTGLVLLPRER